MWEYRGKVVKVVDGDTVDLLLDLGFHVSHQIRVRLARIDAPETTTEEGKAVKVLVQAAMPEGTPAMVKTAKGDRYGRWIGEISTDTITNVSDWLLAGGHAKPYP